MSEQNSEAKSMSLAGDNAVDQAAKVTDDSKLERRYAGKNNWRVPVVGALYPLTFNPGPCSCGKVKDGVSFWFGEGREYQGSWVIPRAAFLELARLAAASSSAGDST